jgi:hypothetical protein
VRHSPDEVAALLADEFVEFGASGRQPTPRLSASSIWKHTEGRWRLVFHQGTPLG